MTSIGRQDGLEVHVSDNGPGIPEPLRHAVLQPFVTYGKARGTGLGLAIVQKILRRHGGEIYLETKPDKGTLVRLILPFVPPRDREPFAAKATRVGTC